MKPLLFLLLLVASPCFAQDTNLAFSDGNALLHGCILVVRQMDESKLSEVEFWNSVKTLGFIEGTINGYKVAAAADEAKTPFLITEGVTTLQEARIIKKWLEDNPKRLNGIPAMLIIDAITDTYPANKP